MSEVNYYNTAVYRDCMQLLKKVNNVFLCHLSDFYAHLNQFEIDFLHTA